MPADIIGTNIIMEDEHGQRSFKFMQGPIFAQIVLADEINRATPKTQSALLEAMQEQQVTAGGTIRKLEEPFFVMATQNPLEQEGTYPLPEAQLDRFFFKLIVQYSGREELKTILDRTTTGYKADIQPVIDGAEDHRAPATGPQRVVIAPHVQDYAIRCMLATHPQGMFAIPMVEPVPARRRQPARGAGDHAGRQGAGAAGWPIPRQLQGHQGSRHPRDAASRDPEFRRRGRRHHDGHGAGKDHRGDADDGGRRSLRRREHGKSQSTN